MPQANNNSIIIPLPRALPQAARKKVEAAIDCHLSAVQALTAFLDEADVDSDLEPSLAGTGGDDREYDPADPPQREGIDDNELDGSGSPNGHDDEEPELGWPSMINQDRASKSCKRYVTDRGNLHGYGYVCDGEPSLGSAESINQTSWGRGNGLDYEQEHDGREPSLGWTVTGQHGRLDDREADYVTYPDGIGQGFTADQEPDIEADREPRLAPFELDQTNGRAL